MSDSSVRDSPRKLAHFHWVLNGTAYTIHDIYTADGHAQRRGNNAQVNAAKRPKKGPIRA
jgi:hypothetical protein